MKTIRSISRKGSNFINAYRKSNIHTLYQCYGKHSTDKDLAYIECKKKFINENGFGFKIISYNSFQFTCGWTTPKGLRVETRCNSYLIILDDRLKF